MASEKKYIKWVIIGFALLIVAYILFKNTAKGKSGAVTGLVDDGCYPFEEIHELTNDPSQSWISFIPYLADGTTSARPSANATSIGSQFTVSNTGSGLDGTYTINSIYYGANGDIGSLRVDTPSGYNFNYNATQGGDPRDMTFFGVGKICLL